MFLAKQTSAIKFVSPASERSTTVREYTRATSMRRAISASVFCTLWRAISGLPKVSRSRHHPRVRSRQRCALAYAWTARPIRSETKAAAIWKKPVFSAPIRFSAGTRASLKDSSAVSEERQPILSSLRLTSKPGVPFSTTIIETPLAPGPPVRTAATT